MSSYAWNCGINWLTRDAFFNSYFGGLGCYHVVVHAPEHYEACDSLGDAYVEAQRMTACRRDCMSPFDLWNSDSGFKQVVTLALAAPKGDVCTWAMREAVYSKVKECTNFKPSLAKHIISFFGAKKVLDFSAGWGERMLGAMAAGVEEYLAFDPNTTLQAGHSLALRTHGTAQQQQNFTIRYEPFESSNLTSEDFTADLVFTSPPFFNLEVYTTLEHASGQSIQSHKGVTAWLVKFLFQALKKAWSCLSRGGHMALHYSDTTKDRTVSRLTPGHNIRPFPHVFAAQVEAMLLYCIGWLQHCCYIGAIGSLGDSGTPRPVWCLRKVDVGDAIPADHAFKARAAMATHFAEVKRMMDEVKL